MPDPRGGAGDDLANGFAVPATHRRVWDFSADGVLPLPGGQPGTPRPRPDRHRLLHDPDDHAEQALQRGVPGAGAAARRRRDRGDRRRDEPVRAARPLPARDRHRHGAAGRPLHPPGTGRAHRTATGGGRAGPERGHRRGVQLRAADAIPGPAPRTTTHRLRGRCSTGHCGYGRCANVTGCRCGPPRCASRSVIRAVASVLTGARSPHEVRDTVEQLGRPIRPPCGTNCAPRACWTRPPPSPGHAALGGQPSRSVMRVALHTGSAPTGSRSTRPRTGRCPRNSAPRSRRRRELLDDLAQRHGAVPFARRSRITVVC